MKSNKWSKKSIILCRLIYSTQLISLLKIIIIRCLITYLLIVVRKIINWLLFINGWQGHCMILLRKVNNLWINNLYGSFSTNSPNPLKYCKKIIMPHTISCHKISGIMPTIIGFFMMDDLLLELKEYSNFIN